MADPSAIPIMQQPISPYDTMPRYAANDGSYSINALSMMIYPPAYTDVNNPVIGEPVVSLSPGSGLNNFIPTPTLPKTGNDWLKLGFFVGVFILVMVYFGSYIVRNT